MCGILAVLNASENHKQLREKIITRSKRIRHRGPDWSGVYSDSKAILAHERLAIVDVSGGAQPLVDPETGRVLGVVKSIITRSYGPTCGRHISS